MSEHLALENITILDLTRVIAGPYCGAMLADLGANVIKIELPGRGDDARAYGPYVNGESLYYGNLNRNKRGITLNLKSEEGKEVFRKLAAKADVVLENYRPGVMDKLGLGYEELKKLNPCLIYAAVSGFGSYGRYSQRPGYDIISQAMGGLMSVTGHPGNGPTRVGSAIGDVLGGLNLTIGILAAIEARHVTGVGQRVDVSLIDSVVASLENAYQRYEVSHENPKRMGNAYASIAPYDSYEASDGWFVIGCGNDKLYKQFCDNILHMPELVNDPRFDCNVNRVANNLELKAIIEENFAKKHTVKECVDMILGAGIPAGPIYNVSDIMEDPHIRDDREMFIHVDHPVMGDVILNGNPVKLSDTKADIRFPSPTLGQHNHDVLSEIGYSDAEIQEMQQKGVL